MRWLRTWLNRRERICSASLHWTEQKTTVQQREHALHTLPAVQAIHSLFLGAGNRLTWKVLRAGEEDEIESRLLDAYAGVLFADWMVLGESWIGQGWIPAGRGSLSALHVEHPRPPLLGAATLLQKLRQLERAQLQLLWRWGALTFMAPAEGSLYPTPQELEAARKALHDSIREAGVGGIELLPHRVEFVELQTKPVDYGVDRLATHYIRELCNLFAVDSSLLNDPENKTYSNKTEAQKALYVNVVIPNAYLFAELVNRQLILSQSPYQITPDPSNLEPLAEEREKQANFLVMLFEKGVISREELREKLGYESGNQKTY